MAKSRNTADGPKRYSAFMRSCKYIESGVAHSFTPEEAQNVYGKKLEEEHQFLELKRYKDNFSALINSRINVVYTRLGDVWGVGITTISSEAIEDLRK